VQALLAGDLAAAHAVGEAELADVLLSTHAGLTAEEFAAIAAGWLTEAQHPRFERPYADLVYAPMLELIDLLRGAGFAVFVVTGGGVEFVRAASERLYGVGPDNVVGSAVQVGFERRDGRVVLVRQAKLLGSPNEGAPKAINIQAHIGRRPIFAAGNSAGDREMLEYVTTGEHPSLAIVIDHDDAEREYAYAGKALTDPDAEAIADTAARFGWTVVSMRDDWARVFAEAAR
jgi:phosphoserine phosphatase